MQRVRQWLSSLDLSQYAEAFERNHIGWELLATLTNQDLLEIGVESLGHRKKLLAAIAELNGHGSSASGAVVSAGELRPQGTEAPAGAGRSLPGERRQLTVLFCDMVGFTELASRVDPEVLQGIVSRYEDTCAAAITRFEGYVFQRLGDGIVAFFGFPLAHEGEAERAIRAGLEIITALSRLDVAEVGHLSVRIGIASGMVVVSSAEKGAVGETMNLSARLQGIAQPGTIVVSEAVRRLAPGVFDYANLGEQRLKGIAKPGHAYRILGLSQAASRFEAATGATLTPLVGREQEVAVLLERWQLARGGEGQVVLLSGEPGIGKSRVLSALCERLAQGGAPALWLQCSPYHVNSAFRPFIEHLERQLDFERDEPAGSKLDKLDAYLSSRPNRRETDAPLLAQILSIAADDRYPPLAMTSQRQKDETIRALVSLAEAAARRDPVLVLFEDAHWADPTSLEVLAALIERVRQLPILFLVTHRPELRPRWLHHSHVAALVMPRLTQTQSSTMVARVAGARQLPPELVAQIVAKTDGVALFVEELTKAVLESGTLTQVGQRYEYSASAASVTIPATLRDSLMARLDRSLPVKEVAQIGAAIGREFSYGLISAVAPAGPAQLEDSLERLTESGLVFRRGVLRDAVFTFKHALVRDAAYDTLLKSRRRELHGRIAQVLEDRFASTAEAEPELLAHHFTEAAQTEQAVGYWCKAGELALKRMAPTEAISHLSRGLELVAALPATGERDARELDLRVPLGAAWMALRGWHAQEVASALAPALELATSLHRPEALLPVLPGLWVNRMTQGRNAESLQFAERMLAEGEGGEDSRLRLVGHMAAMASHWWVGNFLLTRQHGERVLELYDREAHRPIADLLNYDPKTMAHMYNASSAWILGYADTAVREMQAMEVHARWRGHAFDLLVALTFGALPSHYRGDLSEFRGRLDAAREVAQEQGLAFFGEVYAPWLGGFALGQEGRHREAVEALSTGIQAWSELGLLGLLPYARRLLAESLAATGALDQAIEVLDASLEQVARPGWEERVHLAEVLRVRGVVLEQLGRLDDAEHDLRSAIEVACSQQAKSWELRAAMSLARLWNKQGRRGKARELLAPVYAWFTEGLESRDLRQARDLLGSL